MTQKELIRANRDFLHDISTPLMVAHGMIEVGTDLSEADGKAKEKFDKATKAIEKVTALVREHRKLLIELDQKEESS